MTKRFCDKCKLEQDNPNLLTEVYMGGDDFVLDYLNSHALMRGIMYGIELCPRCLQKFNWVAGAFVRGEIEGKDPFADKEDL